MFSHDDILIIGDSFAKHRDSESDWPKLLCKLLTGSDGIPRGRGFSGASWWSTRKCLLAELEVKVPQVLVLCHTESSRIPSDYDFGLNVASSTTRNVDLPAESLKSYVPEIKSAAAQYYTYLHSSDYANWAQAAWYTELENILIKHNIPKVVHLHCFAPYYGQSLLHCFKVGVTNFGPLWPLCRDVDQTTARNHFTAEQNIKIAHAINNTLVNYPGTGEFDMKLSG